MKDRILASRTTLVMALMDAEAKDVNSVRAGRSIIDNLDGLLIVGDEKEIDDKLTEFLGEDWRRSKTSG